MSRATSTPPPADPGGFFREHADAIAYPKKHLATLLGISRPCLYAIFENRLRITVDMAIKLEALFGRPAAEWLNMQNAYDLWKARQESELGKVVSHLEDFRREIHVDDRLEKTALRRAS